LGRKGVEKKRKGIDYSLTHLQTGQVRVEGPDQRMQLTPK